jgi:VanZ family protein
MENSQPVRRRRIKHPLRYVVIALCIAAFVLVNMAIIFALSEESKEESGDRSTGVTAFFVRILYPDYDELDENGVVEAIATTHMYVRKAAHFLEYALLGFLSAGLLLFLRRYMYKRNIRYWVTWVIPTVFCLLYAISDEVHQIFSERGPSAKDVLLDFAGACFGICLIHGITGIVRAAIRRRRKRIGR